MCVLSACNLLVAHGSHHVSSVKGNTRRVASPHHLLAFSACFLASHNSVLGHQPPQEGHPDHPDFLRHDRPFHQSSLPMDLAPDACRGGQAYDYDLDLHIASIFILLVASWASVLVPYSTTLLPQSPRIRSVTEALTFALRYFGGGIILSTAFIHLLYDAYTTLANPCVGNLSFEPTSSAIAMAAVYIMLLLDLVILRPVRRRVRLALQTSQRTTTTTITTESQETLKRAQGSLSKWSILALEAGIVFHSVIIGVNLGTSSGTDWIVILIALTVHQFCEGLSLTSRIIVLPPHAASKVWRFFMHSIFAFSTSLGIAIGVGVRSYFNGDNRTTILVIGVLESLAAGMLIYSALTQIIVQDFQMDEHNVLDSNTRCALAFALFTLGAFVMVSRSNAEM